MGYGIKIEAWGDWALFSRPEMKVERVSYDLITPAAARGLIEAIYFKPAIKWYIDRIQICNPIKFTNIRRNEVKSKLLASNAKAAMEGKGTVNPIYTTSDIQQRASLLLKDVRYIIEAHFELTEMAGESDTVEKHYNIALRRLRNGQCFHQPYFGCREFPASFKLYESEQEERLNHENRDLGYMLYDMDFSDTNDIKPMFFRAVMKDGIIDLKDCEVFR
ncbi:MAG TPA: type I-C CRISPR-associated protein Cas5c [Anaerovoracaceae bacterium]|nr:type I-C CRISPR-associated protein Cas5c [Anaerovoracaceae bacterium]